MSSDWGNATDLVCTSCERRYAPGEAVYTCPSCGLDGILDIQYDYDAVRHLLTREHLAAHPDPSHWRYLPLLPVAREAARPLLPVGWTPVHEVAPLARYFGLRTVYVKDEGRNPTGSLKDRASSVGAVRAAQAGRREITCASTGNAASSLAGQSAQLGLHPYIFLPAQASQSKLAQMLIYGATVFKVRGTYEDAFRISMEAAARWGWYNRNSAVNPVLVEGKKTAGLEIAEQLGWDPPDAVVVPVGDGCTLAGIYKGLHEMQRIGLTSRTPRVIGVQAAGASPIEQAFRSGQSLHPGPSQTIADGIAVGTPRNWRKALRAVRDSGGTYVTVSDEEILEAMRLLAQRTGIWGEPAAVAGVAALAHLLERGAISRSERVLLMITGTGLKDIPSTLRASGSAFEIDASLDAVADMIAKRDAPTPSPAAERTTR
ncbi:MAG: threonine synthase [Armatimonadetes bacterium RBG_19FT_COMBO_69_19]|nr:MAG: threonine synthase [Armatimonadetes bacterium RBG_19FT_COMBO_69_19]